MDTTRAASGNREYNDLSPLSCVIRQALKLALEEKCDLVTLAVGRMIRTFLLHAPMYLTSAYTPCGTPWPCRQSVPTGHCSISHVTVAHIPTAVGINVLKRPPKAQTITMQRVCWMRQPSSGFCPY